jgi:heat shock protein HslJ
MRSPKKGFLMIATLLLLTPACGMAKDETAVPGEVVSSLSSSKIQGINWKFVVLNFEASGTNRASEDARPSLKFNGDRVSGSLGCNGFSGAVEILKDGILRVKDLVSNHAVCDDPVEGYLFDLLTGGFSVQLSGGQLSVRGKVSGEQVQFLFGNWP